MKKLYSFFWDCGRMGSVEGLFIADEEKVDELMGHRIYFGEILGKHSEIYGNLDDEDISVLSEDQEKIEWLEGIMCSKTISGYNPLDYVRINCACCDYEICEGGYWYKYRMIDGKYYCESYDEVVDGCRHDD